MAHQLAISNVVAASGLHVRDNYLSCHVIAVNAAPSKQRAANLW